MKFVLDEKFISDGTVATMTQPQRFKIVKFLKEKGPAFIDRIAKETDIHPRMVSHHIDVLQEQKLVETKYELVKINDSKRDVAVRMCRLSPRAEAMMETSQ